MSSLTARHHGYKIKRGSALNVHIRYKNASRRALCAYTAVSFHHHHHHIGFPPRPQMKEESACVVNAPRTALRIYNMRRSSDPGAFKTNRAVVVHETARRERRAAIHAARPGAQILTIPSFSAACTAILSRVAQDAYYRSRGSPARRSSLVCQRRGTDSGGYSCSGVSTPVRARHRAPLRSTPL